MSIFSLLWLIGLQTAAPVTPLAAFPFAVGEKLSYSAKLGMLTLGSGTLEVASIDTIRGVESFIDRPCRRVTPTVTDDLLMIDEPAANQLATRSLTAEAPAPDRA